MVPTVRGKSGNFTFQSQGKLRESGKVRVQKLTICKKNIFNVCTQSVYDSSEFFLLASHADYLYLHFQICFVALVSSVIASDCKLTLVFRVNK